MSKKYQNRDERMRDIRRYLDKKMTGKERNRFERELQGDSFEEEALEGLSAISPEDLDNDLASLRAGVKGRTHRRAPLFYRIAAAIVVLLAISSLLLVKQLNKPAMMVSENLGVRIDSIEELLPAGDVSSESLKPVASETEADTLMVRSVVADKEETIKEDKAVVAGVAQNVIEDLEVQDEIQTTDSSVSMGLARMEAPVIAVAEQEEEEEAEALAKEHQSKTYVSEERKISDSRTKKAKEAVPQAMAEEQIAGVAVEEKELSDDQVIRVQEAEADPDILSDSGPEPLGGLREFKVYLETDQIFPEEWEASDKETVKMELTIGISGKVENVIFIRSPDKQFSDEAKRLINEGPPWFAAVRDSQRVEETIKIRIVFKR